MKIKSIGRFPWHPKSWPVSLPLTKSTREEDSTGKAGAIQDIVSAGVDPRSFNDDEFANFVQGLSTRAKKSSLLYSNDCAKFDSDTLESLIDD
jgi:hypothetical protein